MNNKMVISGSKSGDSSEPYIADDNLRSIATAKVLLALGEGEWEGDITAENIYLDGTPLQSPSGTSNFESVSWSFRPGTVDQEYIPGFPSVESENTIGVELTSDAPWNYSITNSQISAVVLRFSWPAIQQQKPNGDVVGYKIEYRVEISTDGGAYEVISSLAVNGKSSSTYERSVRVDLPAGSAWDIRVVRTTANQNSSTYADTMSIAAITEVIDRKLRYPNTALLGIAFDANQFNSIPTISVHAKMRKVLVPDNYDPATREYTGTWTGGFKYAYTNNPAWVTYDLIVENRFSVGDRVGAQFLDKYELYKISQYCDQLVSDGKGGQEHRYECNIYIQTATEAWQVLRDISAIYRGMIYWMQSQMMVRADMPRDADYIFSNSNVIDGNFTYSGSDERVKYTRALVSWDDPDNAYETDVTATFDNDLQIRYGDNVIELSAFGCTRESEAQRRGKWAIYTNNNDRTVSFKTGMEGNIPMIGDIIAVADRLVSGSRIGGRISGVSSDGLTITLDSDADVTPGDALLLNLPSGIAESRTVDSVSGRDITVSIAYSETPERFHQWTVESDDLTHQLFQIVNAKKADSETIEFEFVGVAYSPDKFDYVDTGARLEERPISDLPISWQEPPESVSVSQSVHIEQTLAVTTMSIAWPEVEGAVGYDVHWQRDNSEWVTIPRTGQLSVDIKGVYTGQYVAKVRAVNVAGVASIYTASVLTDIDGKVAALSGVQNLTISGIVFGINLNWEFPSDSTDTLYTEIEYADNASGENSTSILISYPTNEHSFTDLSAGVERWFRARIIDRSGNFSDWTTWSYGVSSNSADEILSYLEGQIGAGELADGLIDEIGDVLLEGDFPSELVDLTLPDIENNLIGYLTGDDETAPDDVLWYAGDDETQKSFVGSRTITSASNEDDYANAKEIYILGARVGDNEAYIARVEAVSVSNDQALAEQITQLTATFDDSVSAINNQLTVLSDADSALASDITTLFADVGDNQAAIQAEQTARADADSALASDITTLFADVGDNQAAILAEQTARADADSALASDITTLFSDVGDNSAAIETNATAVADLDGALTANWQVKTEVRSDGKVVQAGVGLGAAIGEDGTTRSEFLVMADTIGFLNTIDGTIHTPFVFDTVNDTAYLNAAIIEDATIDFAKISDTLQSDDFSAGSDGWIIRKDGSVEFNDGIWRGTVYVENLEGDVYKADLLTISSDQVVTASRPSSGTNTQYLTLGVIDFGTEAFDREVLVPAGILFDNDNAAGGLQYRVNGATYHEHTSSGTNVYADPDDGFRTYAGKFTIPANVSGAITIRIYAQISSSSPNSSGRNTVAEGTSFVLNIYKA